MEGICDQSGEGNTSADTNAQWRYYPTFENPADIGTRGVSPKQLSNNDLWWFGPKFLLDDIKTWTEQPDTLTVSVEGKSEERNIALLIKTEGSLSISQVINIEKYRNIKRLERVTALVIRFIRNCCTHERKISERLTIEELVNARMLWVLDAQRQVINELNSNNGQPILDLFKEMIH